MIGQNEEGRGIINESVKRWNRSNEPTMIWRNRKPLHLIVRRFANRNPETYIEFAFSLFLRYNYIRAVPLRKGNAIARRCEIVATVTITSVFFPFFT